MLCHEHLLNLGFVCLNLQVLRISVNFLLEIVINAFHCHHCSTAEQATTIFLHPLWPRARLAIWDVSNVFFVIYFIIMLFAHPLVSVVCRTSRRNADGQDIVFHALAHRDHMFLPFLNLNKNDFQSYLSNL